MTRPPWDEVAPAWREAFELAWQAYVAGSPPVGAVVVDGDGTVVARGRSRRAERHAPANQLAGSRLAHAELNALAALPTDQHA
jgi:tRNA(Arg) A34 adenosine deaminase TadA